MNSPVANKLLSALSDEGRKRILAHAIPVALPLRFSFYESGETPDFAYFLTSGLASIIVAADFGRRAEVTMVGHEGFIGGLQLLGPATGPLSAFMQMEGTGIRVPVSDLKAEFALGSEVFRRALEFTQVQMLTMSAFVGCSLMHPAEARLARWLLSAEDRMGPQDLHLTQEFLGTMLGVQRTTVNMVVSALEDSGLLHSLRGKIKVLNREGLEARACHCYGVTKRLQQGLYCHPATNTRVGHDRSENSRAVGHTLLP